jgi:nucleoside-diphosphate-sugar epimerase
MRITVIGGTEFIGRRIVETLHARGDRVMIVHRGQIEPDDLPPVDHVHVDRMRFESVAGQVHAFAPDAIVDTIALTRTDTLAVVPHLPEAPTVVLSSMDVYRSFELLINGGVEPQPVPIDEASPIRVGRYPYRGMERGDDDYEKLDVEPLYLERGGCVMRLGMVYGPRDPQTREEFVLRRVRAGRDRIPVGASSTVFTRVHVDDVASAVLAALDAPDAAAGQIFNVGESGSFSMDGWMRLILSAADSKAEMVRVTESELPPDMRMTRSNPQHLIASSAKAQALLGWRPCEAASSVASSVAWHLANPPRQASTDFAADDEALAHA